MTKKTLTTLSLAILCFIANGQESLQLVKDISVNKSYYSDPRNVTAVGNAVYFTATSSIHGKALWKSDGTTEGTVLVMDVVPGNDSYEEYKLYQANGQLYFFAGAELWFTEGTPETSIKLADEARFFGVVNDRLLFTDWGQNQLWSTDGTVEGMQQITMPAFNWLSFFSAVAFQESLYFAVGGSTSHQLWKTDGTQEGTTLIEVFPHSENKISPDNFTAGDNLLYFTLRDNNTLLNELWKTDGSAVGTSHVAGLSEITIEERIVLDDILIFEGNAGSRSDLYRSDGTSAGTFILRVPSPGSSSFTPRNLFLDSANHQVYFTGNTDAQGTELWRTDGTVVGTRIVKDINAGSASGVFYPGWALYKNQLYFAAESSTYGYEVFKTNGTTAGTVLLKDLTPGAGGSSIDGPIVAGDVLYIGEDQLWKSDGTTAGTTAIQVDNAVYSLTNLTYANNKVFFVTSTVLYGSELYVSDGTYAGTMQVTNINISSITDEGGTRRGFCELNGSRYFIHDGIWKTDGTTSGTTLLKAENWQTFQPIYTAGSYRAGSTIVFSAADGTTGQEIWKTDGTAEGTVLLKDIKTGPASGFSHFLHQSGDIVYFIGLDATHGGELWRTDGTEAGTYMVKDINPGTAHGYVGDLYELNGAMYFAAQTSANGQELWRTDGTESGTYMVKEIGAGSASGMLTDITIWQGALYFWVQGSNNWDLWRSDGTETGTYVLKTDINSGGSFGILRSTDSEFLFTAHTFSTGIEVWKSDGTEAGTVFVKDFEPGTTSSYPSIIDTLNGKYIVETYAVSNSKLHLTDGTDAGTTEIVNMGTSNYSGYVGWINGKIIFSANNETTGTELYVTDGTADGTFMLKDIYPGASSSSASRFLKKENLIYFTADDGVSGIELWQTDGTICGTKKITNDDHAIIVSDFILNEDQLLFMANSDSYGLELFSYNTLTTIPEGCVFGQTVTFDPVDPQSYANGVVSLNASASSGLPIVLYSSDTNIISIDGTSAIIKNVGTAFITVSQPGNLLFSKATPLRRKVTITTAPLLAHVMDTTIKYGDSHALEISYVGFVNGDDAADLDTPPQLSGADHLDVGEYVLTPYGGSDNNYDISYEAGTVTVEPSSLTFSADPKTKIYGNAIPLLTYHVSGLKGSDDLTAIDNLPEVTTAASQESNTGKYAITLSGGDDNNYDFIFEHDTLTINKAPLTVTADEQIKSYGQEVPELTYTISGLKLRDEIADLDDLPQAQCEVTLQSAPGNYDITLSGGSDANYIFNKVPGTCTVTKAMLTMSPDVTSKVYGDAKPDINFIISGFKFDDDLSDITTLPEAALSITSDSDAGEYEFVIVAGEDDNYEFEVEPKSFTVTKAVLTVKADNAIRVYGGSDPNFTYVIDGFRLQDDENDLDELPMVTSGASVSSPVGTYELNSSNAFDNNYSFEYLPGLLEITKAMLTIAPDDKTRGYGEENPVLTYALSGLVAGDTEASIDVLPVVSTEATTSSNVGQYLITATGAEDDNYDITYETGVLNVVKALQHLVFETIAAQAVDDADIQLKATSTLELPVQFMAVTDHVSINGNVATPLHSGKAIVRAYQEGSENVEAMWVEQEFCINPRKPTLSFNGSALEADAVESSLTYNWFADELPVEDSHEQHFIPESAGTFTVQAMKDECLSARSLDMVLLVTALEPSGETAVKIFPNPTTDGVTIETKQPVGSVTLYSSDGRMLKKLEARGNSNSIHVDLHNVAAGIYRLRIMLESGDSFYQTVMKE